MADTKWSSIHFDCDNRDPRDTLHGGGFGLMVPVDEPRICRPNDEDHRREFYSGGRSGPSGRRFPMHTPRSLRVEVEREGVYISHRVVLPAGGALWYHMTRFVSLETDRERLGTR